MQDKILKKYIIRSFWIHISIIFIALLTGIYNRKIDKHFLVYGAHSKIQTQALFKSNKDTQKTNWYAKRIAQEKELKEKRNARIKAEKAKKTKLDAQKKAKAQKLELAKQKKLEQESKIKELKEKKKKIKFQKKVMPKKPEQKKEPEPEPEKEKPQELEQEITPENNIEETQELVFDLEETSEQDPKLKAADEQIKGLLRTTWHPPIGIPKGTESRIKLIIDNNGNIETFNFTEKSNILIYDLSIINAIKELKFSGFLCSKIITIYFKQ